MSGATMNTLRLARSCNLRPLAARQATRSFAVAASAPTPTSYSPSVIPLSNVEAQWKNLTTEEQSEVYRQLEEAQKRDWKTLSLDEKKAAYYVSFGPHGPRTPLDAPGSGMKVLLGTFGLLGVTGVVFAFARSQGGPLPATMSKEWQQASNERAREEKQSPISGVSSQGYTGKGHIA